MSKLRIYCLGAFQARLDNFPLAFETDKARALLACLAVEAPRPCSRQRLAELLWFGQPEQKALHNLSQALFSLRKTLAHPALPSESPPLLLADHQNIQIAPHSPSWLDVSQFQADLAAALRHPNSPAPGGKLDVQALLRAVNLYRGPFLDQLYLTGSPLFDEWVAARRESLNQQAAHALQLLAAYYERRGEILLARQILHRLAALLPWDEHVQGDLIRLYAIDGQWSAAQNQYYAFCRYLERDIGVQPSAGLTHLAEQVRRQAAQNRPFSPRSHVPRHNLPLPLTPFIGRAAELDQLSALLADPGARLVALLGPGGVGKTRLVLEAARQQIGQYSDGVYLVSLAGLDAPSQLTSALAGALGFHFYGAQGLQEQLAAYLRDKDLLLILDNFEHLLSASDQTAVDWLAWLLESACHARLLVTSRTALNLPASTAALERAFTLGGLELTAAGTGEAIELFAALAHRLQPAFNLRNCFDAVARICRLVDGLPLAIELSAAWLRSYPCAQIAEQIADNLDFLTTHMPDIPSRHRSLRAVFQHSWALLTPDEQTALAGLSIFRGGFTAQAAAQVAEVSLELLLALSEKSLLQAVGERFDLHSLLRQFAAEQLAACPAQAESIARRHTACFSQYLAEHAPALQDGRQLDALRALSIEEDNLRLAWQRMIADYQLVAQQKSSPPHPSPPLVYSLSDSLIHSLIDGLYHFNFLQSRFFEGIELLSATLNAIREADPADSLALGMAALRLSNLHLRTGDPAAAQEMLDLACPILQTAAAPLEEQAFCENTLSDILLHHGQYEAACQHAQTAAQLYQQAGSLHGVARSNFLLGLASYRLGNLDQARNYLQDAVETARRVGEPRILLATMNTLADVICHFGEYVAAQRLFEEILATSRQIGDLFYSALILNNLGTVHFTLERYDQAGQCYQESLELCRQTGDRAGAAIALGNLAEIASLQGDHPRAWQLCQQTLAIGRELEDTWTILAATCGLSEAALAQGDYPGARENALAGLPLAASSSTLQMLNRLAVDLAAALARLGQPEKARAILSAASQHPACADDVRQRALACLAEIGGPLPDPLPTLETLFEPLIADLRSAT